VTRCRRGLSLLLAVLLARPVPAGVTDGSVWSDRRRAVPLDTDGAWAVPPVDRVFPASGSLSADHAPRGARPLVEALAPFGNVRKISWVSDTSPVVIHLHDVHANESAQRNLGRAVAGLLGRAPLDALALEGAFGPVDVERFRRFPDRAAVTVVADHLLAEGRLAGPVHAVLTSTAPAPPVWGVDDAALHAANVEAYRRSVPAVPAAVAALARSRAALAAAPASVPLRRLDDVAADYHAGRAGLGAYLRALFDAAGDAPASPAARAFLDVLSLEGRIDFAAVTEERRRLLERLVPALAPAESDALLARAVDHRAGTLSHAAFYAFLRKLCDRKGATLAPGAALADYIRYVQRADAIDAETLYAELPPLEDAAYRRVARGEADVAWARVARTVTLYEKLAAFALTPPEWRALRSGKGGPAPAGVDWSTFTAFYERADARDGAMARSLRGAMRRNSAARVALVTGGYHAAGLRAALARAGVSVIDFVPRVEAVEDGAAALSVFVREKTPLERLFRGDRLFLAPAPFSPDDQERMRLGVPLVRELSDPGTDHTAEAEDVAALAGPGSPDLVVVALDDTVGAVLSVRNAATDDTVRLSGRLDAAGRLTDVRETPGPPGWGARLRGWANGSRATRVDADAGLVLWGDARRYQRAQDRLGRGRGGLLSRAERRDSARTLTENLPAHGGLDEMFLPGGPAAGGKPPTLQRAVRAAAALFQEESPKSRDGRPLEFWAVEPEGLDPVDRGVARWEETPEKRVLRFRRGDMAAVQRALLEEEILPGFGLGGAERAAGRRLAAAMAEEVLTAGIHLMPTDFWNLRAEEEARFRALTPSQHDRALRAAARARSRLPGLFPAGADIAEEFWAVRTERLCDAGPRRRPTLAGLLGWYGRARALAARDTMGARLVATEELRARFHRLSREAGVATHLAPNGLSFGVQQGLARVESAVRLQKQARAAGAAEAGVAPTVIDGVSRALIDVAGPFVLFAKMANGREAFVPWLERVHRQIVGGLPVAAASEEMEPLARVLPTASAGFARLTPRLVDPARLYLAGALSFEALREDWRGLFESAGIPAEAGDEGLRTLLLVQNLGVPLTEAFERGTRDLVEVLDEQAPSRRLGRAGWDRLLAPGATPTADDARALFWGPGVSDPEVILGDGVDHLLGWVGDGEGIPDPEAAVRDFVMGWAMTDAEARIALPILESAARRLSAELAPTPEHRAAAEGVIDDIRKGTVSPVQRAARWIQFLGTLLTPDRFDPPTSDESSPALALRVFENTLRKAVFSLDAFLSSARAVREIYRWERGERGLSSGRGPGPTDGRFPWTGQRGALRSWAGLGLGALVGAGFWGAPGPAEAAGLTVPAFVDALWPAATLLAGTAVLLHGLWRARRAARETPRRAADALSAAVAARAPDPLERLLDELEAAPLSLGVDGSAFLRTVVDRGWEGRRAFLGPLRARLRQQGVAFDFVSLRTALASVFRGDYPVPADAPVLRVWLADEVVAGRVPRAPGPDALVVALDPAAAAVLRAAGHAPLDGAGLVVEGALSLAAVERLALARGFDPARFAACRLMAPLSLPLRADGARTDLFRQAIVVLMDALRSLPLKPLDLDAIDRVARAIASAA
jgi:hypothetical protein